MDLRKKKYGKLELPLKKHKSAIRWVKLYVSNSIRYYMWKAKRWPPRKIKIGRDKRSAFMKIRRNPIIIQKIMCRLVGVKIPPRKKLTYNSLL